MTTFTSDDREEEYKKIVEAAPFQPGYEDAMPIPFAGWVNASPPHIVDSGASVITKELTDEEIAEEWAKFYPDVFHTHLIDFARAILRKAQEK
jgi:hypothetical protein